MTSIMALVTLFNFACSPDIKMTLKLKKCKQKVLCKVGSSTGNKIIIICEKKLAKKEK